MVIILTLPDDSNCTCGGTRLERTEQIALQTLNAIKREVGLDNVEISFGFVGTQPPNYPINTIYLWSSGSEEAVLQVQLKRSTGGSRELLTYDAVKGTHACGSTFLLLRTKPGA
jgi:hypothetical protein